MKNQKAKLPIGVFDSGIGGISVLAEILKILSHEEFIYFADTLHSPYGIKPENIVQSLSIKAAEFLSLIGIKSLVIACNTATSAAINEIRKMHAFPVIGMEPAVKFAVDLKPKGKIIVMATPLTLQSKKFNELVYHYKHLAEIIHMPCAGLVEIIEQDYSNRREIENYLLNLFSSGEKKDISIVVLGCTHYILIKEEIMKILGGEIHVIDGNCGTAKHLRTVLQNKCLLNNTVTEKPHLPLKAHVKFYISGNGNGIEARCKHLLLQEGIICE